MSTGRSLHEIVRSLTKALDTCHAAEVTQQVRAIKLVTDVVSSPASTTVSAVNKYPNSNQFKKPYGNFGSSHAYGACPTYSKLCNSCNKQNNFVAYCRCNNLTLQHDNGKARDKPRRRGRSKIKKKAPNMLVHTSN